MRTDKLSLEQFLSRWLWLLPLILYTLSAAPGAGWIDSPMIAYHVHTLRSDTWVNTHNLFHILGKIWSWIFPIGELHYRLNILCALCGAICVQLMFNLMQLLCKDLRASLIASIALTLSHSLWWHSSMLEVYALNSALMAGALYTFALFDRTRRRHFLFTTYFVIGLGITNHVLMGLFLIPLFLIALTPNAGTLRRPSTVLMCLVSLLVGSQLYIFLFIKDLNQALLAQQVNSYSQTFAVFKQVIDDATGGSFKSYMFPDSLSFQSKANWKLNYLFLLLLNFPSLLFLIGFFGFFCKPQLALTRNFLLLALLTQALWSSNYLIWDMYAFGLPVWIMFSVFVALGLTRLTSKNINRACVLGLCLGPLLYFLVPSFSRSAGFWRNYFAPMNYLSSMWDVGLFFGQPWKHSYDKPRKVADAIYAQVPVGSHFFDDDGKGYYPLALYYQKVLGERADIHYHQIFGPQLNTEKSIATAKEMLDLLQDGQEVFISSGLWPERPILDALFALLSPDFDKGFTTAQSLELDKLEQTFPVYELKRTQLFGNQPYYVYHIVKRNLPTKSNIIEAEHLGITTRILSGPVSIQDLGQRWSAGKHLLWFAKALGEELTLAVDFEQSFNGRIFARPTLSNDFVMISLTFDDQLPISYNGYASQPTPGSEVLIANGSFAAGRHTLRIRVIDLAPGIPNNRSLYGFGLDYLRVQ